MNIPISAGQPKTEADWKQLAYAMNVRAEQAEDSKLQAQKTARAAVIAFAVCTVGGLVAAATLLSRFPLERYLYTDNAKAICDAQFQEEPLVTTNTVTEFAKECVLDMDTFAHDTFDRDLSRTAGRCFTPGFRKKYMEMPWLKDRVDTVRDGYLRVSSQTTGPVLVVASNPTADGYHWRVQVPIKRSFRQGESPKGSNERVYEVDVYRVLKDAYNPVGLGINAIYERSGVLK